jgi:hypothetical protein
MIQTLTIRPFDPVDAFRLLSVVGSVSKAEKRVELQGGYVTTEGGEMEIEFRGSVQDAQPVKEFLEPQLRAAQEKDLSVTFEVKFTEKTATVPVDSWEGELRKLSAPQYELRAHQHGPGDLGLEVWQLPAKSTPHLKRPVRLAGLRGRNLSLIEHRVIRKLAQERVKLTGIPPKGSKSFALGEDLALMLGLLFRTLAPMRSRENMQACAEGIEVMTREEAGYWLGMAMYRKNPRRVLSALRLLLTDPKRR